MNHNENEAPVNKYQHGLIYKIVAYETEDVYIGSTIVPLNQRYSNHKSAFKVWMNTKKRYCSSAKMFEKHGLDNCKIELIESFPCDSRKMLEAREGWYMNEYDCVNGNKAGVILSKAEYNTQYQKENKELIKTRKNQKHNCQCGGKFTHTSKVRHMKTNTHQEFIKM